MGKPTPLDTRLAMAIATVLADEFHFSVEEIKAKTAQVLARKYEETIHAKINRDILLEQARTNALRRIEQEIYENVKGA